MEDLDNRAKWLTAQQLLEKLLRGIASGEISKDAVVVCSADEFDEFYPVLAKNEIKYDLSSEIKDCDHMAEYYSSRPGASAGKMKRRGAFYRELNRNGCIWIRNIG